MEAYLSVLRHGNIRFLLHPSRTSSSFGSLDVIGNMKRIAKDDPVSQCIDFQSSFLKDEDDIVV